MNVQDILKELPAYAERYLELAKRFPQLRIGPERVLAWAGTQRQRRPLVPSVVAFGSGVLVGAAAALVLAPRSGAELRRELLERLGQLMQRDGGPAPTPSSEREPGESRASEPGADGA